MLIKLFFSLIILCITSQLHAKPLTSIPDTSNGAVVVNVTMFLLDVNEISGVDQSFNANVFYELKWKDDHLAHNGKEDQKLKLDDIWHPNMQFPNETFLRRSMPRVVTVSPKGDVTYIQRVVGDFSQQLTLSSFPFDVQTFEISLVSTEIDQDKINIKPLDDNSGHIADSFSLADWDVISHSFDAQMYQPIKMKPASKSVSFKFTVKRKIGYYWLHIILPLIFIVMMSMMIFWISPKESGVQIGVSTTSMLTLIAYRYAITNTIPHVSYLTRLDLFILISTIIVFFSLIHSLVTAKMFEIGKEKLAIKLDWISRFLFPFIFLFIIVYVLVLPRNTMDEAEWSMLIPALMEIFT